MDVLNEDAYLLILIYFSLYWKPAPQSYESQCGGTISLVSHSVFISPSVALAAAPKSSLSATAVPPVISITFSVELLELTPAEVLELDELLSNELVESASVEEEDELDDEDTPSEEEDEDELAVELD